MKGNDGFCPGPASDFTGLFCCEMILLGRDVGVCLKKSRLDIKPVRALCKGNNFINVIGRVKNIRYIGYLLPRGNDGNLVAQGTQSVPPAGIRAGDFEGGISWSLFV